MRVQLVLLGLGLLLQVPLNVWAAGYDHDEYTLDITGYSYESIYPAQVQVNRMEGRYPVRPPSHFKQLLYNFLNNDWIESKEPLGHDYFDAPNFPRIPSNYRH